MEKGSSDARWKFESIFDMSVSSEVFCVLAVGSSTSGGGGGGCAAVVDVVWDMHRAGRNCRCNGRHEDVRQRKARNAEFCDMLGVLVGEMRAQLPVGGMEC